MKKRGFTGKKFIHKAKGFLSPTDLPNNEETAQEWQKANKTWWEQNPMRYDWRIHLDGQVGSKKYFEDIDNRFFSSVKHYMPWKDRPFDNLIDFENLDNFDLLEIGVGYGSHAKLIAPYCNSYTGIDLTKGATEMTASRLKMDGIKANILQMDAEKMAFSDCSFDLIWSWGVIHHSANTLNVLKEMNRVMKPGGKAVVMVYYRSFWSYYFVSGILFGLSRGLLWKKRGMHEASQAITDGAIARYYNVPEWYDLCHGFFNIEDIMITGQKTDVIPLPSGKIKQSLEKYIPDALTRLLTNKFRMGSFLIVKMTKC